MLDLNDGLPLPVMLKLTRIQSHLAKDGLAPQRLLHPTSSGLICVAWLLS